MAQRLKDAVTQAGGPATIARKSGVEERTLQRWMAGESEPGVLGLAAVVDACRTSVGWVAAAEVTEMSGHLTLLPRLAVRASAGGGAIAISEEVEEMVAVSRDWLRRFGVNPRFAKAMFADGDSMHPTIANGDLLIVDESVERVGPDGLYVVVYHDGVMVKRIQKELDGSITLKSDNPQYRDIRVTATEITDLRIAGRVRWYGRSA